MIQELKLSELMLTTYPAIAIIICLLFLLIFFIFSIKIDKAIKKNHKKRYKQAQQDYINSLEHHRIKDND